MVEYFDVSASVEPDLERHVAGERNAQRVRDGRERIERRPRHAGVDLEQVVARGLLVADHRRGDRSATSRSCR